MIGRAAGGVFTKIVGLSSVGAFASEVKRSAASHEDAKAPRFVSCVNSQRWRTGLSESTYPVAGLCVLSPGDDKPNKNRDFHCDNGRFGK